MTIIFNKKLNYYSVDTSFILTVSSAVAFMVSLLGTFNSDLIFKMVVSWLALPLSLIFLIIRLVQFKALPSKIEIYEDKIILDKEVLNLKVLSELSITKKGDFYSLYIGRGFEKLLSSKTDYQLITHSETISENPRFSPISVDTYCYSSPK